MKKIIALLAILTATNVFAAVECTKEDKAKWQDKTKFQADLVKQGYKIDVFKETKGNCYEIYGKDSAGKKVEIYFNPVDGAKIKERVQ